MESMCHFRFQADYQHRYLLYEVDIIKEEFDA